MSFFKNPITIPEINKLLSDKLIDFKLSKMYENNPSLKLSDCKVIHLDSKTSNDSLWINIEDHSIKYMLSAPSEMSRFSSSFSLEIPESCIVYDLISYAFRSGFELGIFSDEHMKRFNMKRINKLLASNIVESKQFPLTMRTYYDVIGCDKSYSPQSKDGIKKTSEFSIYLDFILKESFDISICYTLSFPLKGSEKMSVKYTSIDGKQLFLFKPTKQSSFSEVCTYEEVKNLIYNNYLKKYNKKIFTTLGITDPDVDKRYLDLIKMVNI